MNRYQIEVIEKITHLVTVLADNEQDACEKVLGFNGDEHAIAGVEFNCLVVKRLENAYQGKDNGRNN